LLAGQAQVMFDVLPESIGHIKSGKLRSLAVTTATRSDALPDVLSVADFAPGFETSTGRHRRAKEHSHNNHRQAQHRDQRCLDRS
jgi:hypothetical protein